MRRDGRPVPRLHVSSPLAAGTRVPLSDGQRRYLARVMRLGQGDAVRLFNGADGEWLARLGDGSARCDGRLRAQTPGDGPWLLFSPPKRDRLRFLVEKATELGAGRLTPVTLERTEPPAARPDRLAAWALEAAEQCGRLDVPACRGQRTLDEALGDWPRDRVLYLCDASGEGRPLAGPAAAPAAFLVGPEGGFAPAELEGLKARPMVVPVSLGPHVLRVETAAAAALAAWQTLTAVAGVATGRDGAAVP